MKNKTPFGSEGIITEHISEADLKTYFVGFNFGKYRWDDLVDKLIDVIVDFAFGYHEGILTNTRNRKKLKEAALSIYKIENYNPLIKEHRKYKDEDDFFEKKYGRRGEFGELILHLLLRDFHDTLCLVSKIFFKDSDGVTVHGFDAVHLQVGTKTLWLGESKLHKSGKTGVEELVADVKVHFEKDYLRREFALISKKKHSYKNPADIPEIDKWFKLIDERNTLENIFKSVTIPLLCTYTSDVFTKHHSEKAAQFIKEYEAEMRELKANFDKNKANKSIGTNLNIILFLFPVPDKNVLIKMLHEKLHHAQQA